MKKIYIISGLLIAGMVIFFKPVCNIIRKFESLAGTEQWERGAEVPVNLIQVYDLQRQKDTVIQFNKVKVLNFWASWCKPCISEMKGLQQLAERYPVADILLFSYEDTISQRNALAQFKIGLPAYFIRDTTVFNEPALLPRTIILSGQTVVADLYTARDWNSKEMTALVDSAFVLLEKR